MVWRSTNRPRVCTKLLNKPPKIWRKSERREGDRSEGYQDQQVLLKGGLDGSDSLGSKSLHIWE